MRNMYTDAVKDAIGNDPVIDQYEFDYSSAYVGSSADDHMTGTFLTKTPGGLTYDYRGRKFSTFTTENINSLGNSTGEITKFPRASARLQSDREISSTQQLRFAAQFFDDKERFYDSCLPDLFKALSHDGTHIKSLTTSMKVDVGNLYSGSLISVWDWTTVSALAGGTPTVSLKEKSGKDMDALLSLSPMATFVTKSLGFVTFNVPRLNDADDPSINNDWTWSYPYESKYDPTSRLLKVNDVLNLNVSTAKTLPALSGSLLDYIFPPAANAAPYASAPRNLPHQSYYSETGKVYQINAGIVPVLHGKHSTRHITSVTDGSTVDVRTRNGSRTWNVYDSDSYFYPVAEQFDDDFGHSTVLMGDTFFNNTKQLLDMKPGLNDVLGSTHPQSAGYARNVWDLKNWGIASPQQPYGILSNMEEYMTGSATKSDLIKFFFGFGDVNNMTYVKSSLNTTSASYTYDITEDLQAGSDGALLSFDISESDSEKGKTTYAFQLPNASIDALGSKYSWRIVTKDLTTGGSPTYHSSGSWATTGDVRWNSGSSPSNDNIIGSGSPMWGAAPLGVNEQSRMYVDIFSESPWKYEYARGVVAGTGESFLKVSTHRIHVHGNSDLITSSVGSTNISYDLYSNLDPAATYFFLNPSDSYGDVDYVTGSTGELNLSDSTATYTSDLRPPGLWRLMFYYHNATAGGASDDINRAFIMNLKFKVFGKSTYTVDETYKMGCNNYPEFRTLAMDARNCPKDDDYPAHYFANDLGMRTSGLLNDNDVLVYTNRNKNFRSTYVGIGPIIRGWKYGLVSGFPTYSRAVWRRNRYGQLRDMLEQRPYSKFIYDHVATPLSDVATPGAAPSTIDGKLPQMGQLEPGPVEVNYVRRRYRRDDRGIGYIYSEKVEGDKTLSQNISNEVTSSVPYVDGVARLRQEADLSSVKPYTLTSVSTDDGGITII